MNDRNSDRAREGEWSYLSEISACYSLPLFILQLKFYWAKLSRATCSRILGSTHFFSAAYCIVLVCVDRCLPHAIEKKNQQIHMHIGNAMQQRALPILGNKSQTATLTHTRRAHRTHKWTFINGTGTTQASAWKQAATATAAAAKVYNRPHIFNNRRGLLVVNTN